MIRQILIGLFAVYAPLAPAAAMDVATFLAHPRSTRVNEVTGYVVSKYTCPPCPPPAQCKPCIGDHLQIADTTAPGQPILTVLCEPAAQAGFQIGQRYRLEVEYPGINRVPPFGGYPRLLAARQNGAAGDRP